MKKFFSNDKGFTLVEVIISIAILSLASVVVLRLFVTSVDMNTESRHSDISGVIAANFIETVKLYDDTESMVRDMDGLLAMDEGYVYQRYLSMDFKPLQDNQDGNRAYEMKGIVTPKDSPGLFTVSVTVRDLTLDKDLAAFATTHYFKKEVALHDE